MNPDFTANSQISGDETFEDGEYSQDLKNQHRDYSKLLRYGMLGLLGLMVAVGAVFGGKNLIQTEPETKEVAVAKPLPVVTLRAKPVESYQVMRTYTGEIAAIRTSELGFERGGKLVNVFVKEGDRVKSGQPIAKIKLINFIFKRMKLKQQKPQTKEDWKD